MYALSRLSTTRLIVLVIISQLFGCALPPNASAQGDGPSEQALDAAREAFARHARRIHNKHLLTIVDYDLPFTSERLWVLDMDADGEVLARTHVSHAWASGGLYATKFSNRRGSNLSSVGSYVTQPRTYQGRYGHSLRVRGLDRAVNDHALRRAIVFHPAGTLTHSLGCFMLPSDVAAKVFDMISGGTFVYVHRGS